MSIWGDDRTELCYNCGWNADLLHRAHGYTSRLKAMYVRGNHAIYEIGPDWLIRDEINSRSDGTANDCIAQAHLKAKGLDKLVPLVEMHHFDGRTDDRFAFTVMSRASGLPLSKVLPGLTVEQKKALGMDLARHIKTWRKLTSERLETGDGKQLRDNPFRCRNQSPCRDVPFDEGEWLSILTPTFRKCLLSHYYHKSDSNTITDDDWQEWVTKADKTILQIKSLLLEDHRSGKLGSEEAQGGRYVFTHGDLNDENIFAVEEEPGKWSISAIIDWEFAGYWPWWAEKFNLTRLSRFMPDDAFSPGYDPKAWKQIFGGPLGTILNSLHHTAGFFDHTPSDHNNWHRRPFCKCKPYSQFFWGDEAPGIPLSHLTECDDGEPKGHFETAWQKLIAKEKMAAEVEHCKDTIQELTVSTPTIPE